MDMEAWLLIRRQRHSFLNHLQVISGWLQLNQPDRAHRYLKSVAETVAADGKASGAVSPELGLILLDLALEAETYGVRIHWQVLGEPSAALATGLRERVMAALQGVSSRADDQRALTVTLRSDGFDVHTPQGAGEG